MRDALVAAEEIADDEFINLDEAASRVTVRVRSEDDGTEYTLPVLKLVLSRIDVGECYQRAGESRFPWPKLPLGVWRDTDWHWVDVSDPRVRRRDAKSAPPRREPNSALEVTSRSDASALGRQLADARHEPARVLRDRAVEHAKRLYAEGDERPHHKMADFLLTYEEPGGAKPYASVNRKALINAIKALLVESNPSLIFGSKEYTARANAR